MKILASLFFVIALATGISVVAAEDEECLRIQGEGGAAIATDCRARDASFGEGGA